MIAVNVFNKRKIGHRELFIRPINNIELKVGIRWSFPESFDIAIPFIIDPEQARAYLVFRPRIRARIEVTGHAGLDRVRTD